MATRLRTAPLICGDTPYRSRRTPDPSRAATSLPLVTIITVVRNAAATVAETIESVAAQTYVGPIEYIVIDGASTDGTLEVIERYDAHVDCLVSEPDAGIYEAMNKGLRRARGRYVALLNADDRLLPDFVQEGVRALEETGADISYCGWIADDAEVSPDLPDGGLLFNHQGFRHNTFLHRHSCFERIGGFDTDFEIIADAKWYRAAYLSGLTFARARGTHYFYSMDGVSNARTQAQRDRMIAEQVRLSLSAFDMLDEEMAKTIYLSNFSSSGAQELCTLHARFLRACPLLAEGLAQAVRWNIRHRAGYMLQDNPDRLDQILTIAEHFDIGLDTLRGTDAPVVQALLEILAVLQAIVTARGEEGRSACLHFAQVFSTETETFIHDLLGDMATDDPDVLHVMLCDRRINADVRPWPHVLVVAWDTLAPLVRRRLYELIWSRLAPARVIAHFALNGWVLHQRLTPAQRTVPWLNMCHGIDVFTVSEKPDYGAWVREYCALAPRVGFTAVSGFLRDLLIAQGVPSDKITVVPNAISPVFLGHCKAEGFWRPGRTLRILSIGRLIGWKGQGILLHALARLREMRPDVTVHVTFIYGREARELDALKDLARALDLEQAASFVPFVDVRSDPGVLAGYDLFVLPSTLSGDAVPRTETFGVAILEAMAAGLPVIGTDAGGIPEVVGPQDAQSRIVPHGRPEPLAEAMAAMIDAPEAVFIPAHARAEERTRRFAPAVRLRALADANARLSAPRRRIVHFCALNRGGAGGASLNIHRALLRRGYDSIFVTRAPAEGIGNLPGVVMLTPETSLGFEHMQAPQRPGFTIFSLDDESVSDATLRTLVAGADLINLTWSARFLSASNIATLSRLGAPVVITLRDMHMITGGCHFFHGCDGWQSGCTDCPQLPIDPRTGYAGLTFRVRAMAWNHAAISFAALSDHSLGVLSRSPLTSPERCIKLPNYVDTTAFHPDPKPMEELEDLPPGIRIGYLPSFNSRIKGHTELVAALHRLHARRPDLPVVLVMATNGHAATDGVPFAVHSVARLEGTDALRRFYNAVDLVVVPSLEETFSNTCLEALACGTPVAGFATGILPEVLADGRLGACATVGSVDDLGAAIEDVASRRFDRDEVARAVAESFGVDARIDAYQAAFERLMANPPVRVLPDVAAFAALADLAAQHAVIRTAATKALLSKPARSPKRPTVIRNVARWVRNTGRMVRRSVGLH